MGNIDTDTKDGAKADTKADTGATYTKLDTCFLCGKPADPQLVCDKCGLVAACSEVLRHYLASPALLIVSRRT